jgi:hypothetical protein
VVRHIDGERNGLADILSRQGETPRVEGLIKREEEGVHLIQEEAEMESIISTIGNLRGTRFGKRRAHADVSHPTQILGWMGELLAGLDSPRRFKKGSRIKFNKKDWDSDFEEGYFFGVVMNEVRNKGKEPFWRVLFDDEKDTVPILYRVVKDSLLSAADDTRDEEGEEKKEEAEEVIVMKSTDSNEDEELSSITKEVRNDTGLEKEEIRLLDRNKEEDEVTNKKEKAEDELKKGDLVFVNINHTDLYIPLYDQLRPMAVVEETLEEGKRIRIQMMSQFDTILITDRGAVERIAKIEEIQRLEGLSSKGFSLGLGFRFRFRFSIQI